MADIADPITNLLQVKLPNGNLLRIVPTDETGVYIPQGVNALEVASLSAGSLNADLVPSRDVNGFGWFSLQIAGTFVGTLTLQGSNDNVNFQSITAQPVNSLAVGVTTAFAAPAIVHGIVAFRYLRVRMTAYTSGTATGTLELYREARALQTFGVAAAQNGVWTVTQSGVFTAVPNGATTGGATPFHLVSAATANPLNVKASAGQVYDGNLTNTIATVRYVKLFNKASAPALGTDTPIRTYQVPANGSIPLSFPVGLTFALGISLAITANPADLDNTAVAAGDVIVDLGYK